MSKFCEHGDYGQACPRCHYEVHDGKCCCDSCQLIRARDFIAEIKQQRDELLKDMEEVFRIAKMNQSTWGGWMRDHAQKAIAKVKPC